jgi:phosphohistidine phosphatase SixA
MLAACAGPFAGPARTPTAAPTAAPTSVPTATPLPETLLDDPALLAALRRGGYVIYLRHTTTNIADDVPESELRQHCQAHDFLTKNGRRDAQQIGASLHRLGIPIGAVQASPYCWTLATAQLAFGRAEPAEDLGTVDALPTAAAQVAQIAALRRRLALRPAGATNTVLIGHHLNLQDATGLLLAEGEAAVFEPQPGGFRLAARVQPARWAALELQAHADR